MTSTPFRTPAHALALALLAAAAGVALLAVLLVGAWSLTLLLALFGGPSSLTAATVAAVLVWAALVAVAVAGAR